MTFTAHKSSRWHGSRWQQWLDIEAKLLGKGRLLAHRASKKPTYIHVTPSLSTIASLWNRKVLMDDAEWGAWVEEWEGTARPFTTDPAIWSWNACRLLAIVLPVVPYGGVLWQLKERQWYNRRRWSVNGRSTVIGVILDDGPERFVLWAGWDDSGNQLTHEATLGELAYDYLENGIVVDWNGTDTVIEFFNRVRRQYFPEMPEDGATGSHFKAKLATPNSSRNDWQEVLSMRLARATAGFLRGARSK